MNLKLYKYQGAGNDFIVLDNRDALVKVEEGILSKPGFSISVETLCDRRYGIGADGLMLLENSQSLDFKMLYFNSDGSGGMMCGNGGRCMVAFAKDCGIEKFDFEAADGFHSAEILSDSGNSKVVRLKMKDIDKVTEYEDGYFLDTGTRHFVTFVDEIASIDVFGRGRELRYDPRFAPIGTNVNFVKPNGNILDVRTYEKGVEDETYACGTGIVASSIASYVRMHGEGQRARQKFEINALRDKLSVDFCPCEPGSPFVAQDVWLTGPAVRVAEILI